MAHIEKRKKGQYRVRWREFDGSQRSFACPDRTTALQIKLEVERSLALGQRWITPEARERANQAQIDLREILTAYIKESVRVNRRSTAEGHARNLDVFLRFLAQKKGAEKPYPPRLLSKRLLADFYDWTEFGLFGRPRKVTTRRRLVNAVELVWRWAYEEDEYGDAIPRPRRLRMPKSRGQVTVAPRWTEMDACIAATQGWQKPLYVVLRFTGLRVQQAMMLRWDDIDLDRMTLRIRPELGKTQQEQSGRVVPLSKHLVEEMATWGRREGWLIASGRKPGPRQRQARGRDARRSWKRAGVREEACRQPHHAFRKGFVSELKRAGADPDAVEFLVGHSLGLRGVYTDPEALPLREAVGLIPQLSIKKEVIAIDDLRQQNQRSHQ